MERNKIICQDLIVLGVVNTAIMKILRNVADVCEKSDKTKR